MEVKVLDATLLSIEEFEENQDIIKNGGVWWRVPWWLRSPWPINYYPDRAAGVTDGSVANRGLNISLSYTVRPVLILESKNLRIGSQITYAGQTFTVLKDGLAVCDKYIGYTTFREDSKAKDADVYEASDVKKYVDAWFSRNGDIAETVEE